MTQKQSLALLLSHLAVSVAVLGAATFLCANGKIDGAAVTALFGAAIALVGGTTQALGAAAINGGPKPDLKILAQAAPETMARTLERDAEAHRPAGDRDAASRQRTSERDAEARRHPDAADAGAPA